MCGAFLDDNLYKAAEDLVTDKLVPVMEKYTAIFVRSNHSHQLICVPTNDLFIFYT